MYKRKEVESIVDIPARRIQFYSESGLLSMEDESPGKGRERLYSKTNVVELFVIRSMSSARIELNKIKQVMELVRLPVLLANAEGELSMVAKKSEPVEGQFSLLDSWMVLDAPAYIILQFKSDDSTYISWSLGKIDEMLKDKLVDADSIFVIDFKRIIEKVKSL